MIVYQDNYLNESEIDHLLSLWDNDRPAYPRMQYNLNFFFLDLIACNSDLTPIKDGIFKKEKFSDMRLQKYDESIIQTEYFHGHYTIHNYIMYLNEDYEGGELEFENGLFIKPQKGSLVYFNNNEKHRVKNCVGDRYIFTALGDIKLDIKYESIKKLLI